VVDNPVLRIRDIYPGSGFLSIPDPGSNNIKRGGGKTFLVLPFFEPQQVKKICLEKHLRITVFFTQKFVI
jgi:hypothetical protein